MDVYPVTLTLPDGTKHRKTKIRMDGSGLTVWGWDASARSGVEVYTSAEVTEHPDGPGAKGRGRWVTPDGATLEETCACGGGSPIRRWRPPTGNVAVATP